MHYFMIEAIPKPDNDEGLVVGGAYVSCWVNFPLLEGAEVLANYYIAQEGWLPGKVHERQWVEAKYYESDAEYLAIYQEAETEGVSLLFHTWDRNAHDAATASDTSASPVEP